MVNGSTFLVLHPVEIIQLTLHELRVNDIIQPLTNKCCVRNKVRDYEQDQRVWNRFGN